MCIIAFQKEGTDRLPRENLAYMRRTNSDGMGIMYARHGQLHIWKTLEDFEGLWNRYTSVRDKGLAVGLHFRIKTQGHVLEKNCHPFWVYEGDMAVMHNGSIPVTGIPEDVTDTEWFCRDVLQHLPGNFLSMPNVVSMVEDFIGASKLLFMDNEGRYSILNESRGVWRDDNQTWYSHGRYRPQTTSTSKSKKKASNGYGYGSRDHRGKYCTNCGESAGHYTASCPHRDYTGDCPHCGARSGHGWIVRQDKKHDEVRPCPDLETGKVEVWDALCDWLSRGYKVDVDKVVDKWGANGLLIDDLDKDDDADQPSLLDPPEDESEETVDLSDPLEDIYEDPYHDPMDSETWDEGAKRVLDLPDGQGMLIRFVNNFSEEPYDVHEECILYDGMIACYDCLPDGDDFNPSLAEALPKFETVPFICRYGCGEVIHDPLVEGRQH